MIDDQLAAIATGRFADALALASTAYRAATDRDAFEQVIREGFPTLLSAQGHESSACVAVGDRVETLVRVRSEDAPLGTELVYELVRENGTWRVDTAGRAEDTQPAVRA